MNVRRSAGDVGLVAGVTLAYFAAGKLGLSLAFVNASASPVWPPTGLAIAAVLVFGRRALPGVLVGAFLTNVTTAGSIVTSLLIAGGNTLEAFVAVELVRRFAHGRDAFERPGDFFRFAGVTTFVATPISATIGVATLVVAGLAPASMAGIVWTTWWLGDAAGAVVFAPVLVLWARHPRVRWTTRQWAEAMLLLVSTTWVALVTFGGPGVDALAQDLPLEFVCLPLVVWAAYRFSQREAATITLLVAGIAVFGTLRGQGPFARPDANQSLLLLQSFVAVITLLALPLAAVMAERKRAGDTLAALVAERTQELEKAQAIAHVGSWSRDMTSGATAWSDELFRIHGLEPQSLQPTPDTSRAFAFAQDYAASERIISEAAKAGGTFDFDHRIRRADGQVRTLHAQGEALLDAAGRPTRVQGTAQDVTDLRASEARFRTLVEAAPDAIVIVSSGGTIVLVNHQAELIFGYPRDDLVGRPIETLVPTQYAGKHPTHREHYFDDPKTRPMGVGLELRARRKDGSVFPVEISLSPIQTADGLHVMAVVRDVTEKDRIKRVEREQFVTKKLVRRMMRQATLGAAIGSARRQLGRDMASEAGGRALVEHIEAFNAMGLGMMETASEEGPKHVFRGRSLLEVTPGSSAATCHLALGFLEGAVCTVTGEDALGAETTCQSQGHECCTFVVVARPRAEKRGA